MRRWIALCALLTALSGCKDEDTRLPLIAGASVTPIVVTALPVSVEFTVANQVGTQDTLTFSYSADGRRTFVLATPAAGSSNPLVVAGTPTRTVATFLWDAVADLGPGLHNDVSMRIVSGRSVADSNQFVVDASDWLEPVGGSPVALGEPAAGSFPDGSVWVAGGLAGGTLSASAYRYDPAADAAAGAGALSVARTQFGWAALTGGQVLVVGGTLGGAAVGTLDLATLAPGGAVTVTTGTAVLAAPRALPAVAGLGDGRAVIVGGETGAGAATQLELYTPGPGGGTLAAGLTDAALGVVGATATRLADGRVLIAGGDTGAGVTGSLIFLAADGGSLAVAPVAMTPRAEHRAVLLPDGRVALLGGTTTVGADGGALAAVEVFDPVAGTLAALDSLSEPRRRPGCAYVDGALLAVGGGGSANAPTTAERLELGTLTPTWTAVANASGTARGEAVAVAFGAGQALVVGGQAAPERYVPDADVVVEAFEALPSRTAARADHTATRLIDGRVLIVGGTDLVDPALSTAELFEPNDRTFSAAAPLSRARAGHAAAAVGDTVLVVGGADDAGALVATAEQYDRLSGSWSDAGALGVPRRGARAVAVDAARVLVVGGVDAGGAPVDAVEQWDTTSRAFTTVASLSEARGDHDALRAGVRVLVGPGTAAGGPSAALDVLTESPWSAAGLALDQPRAGAALAAAPTGDLLLVIGGADAALSSTVALVDLRPAAPALLSGQITLTAPRRGHRAAPIGERVLAAGGLGTAGLALDTADVVAVDAAFAAAVFPRSVTPVGTAAATNDRHLNAARSRHTVTPLGDGRLLIVGGVDHRGVAVAGGEVYR